MFDKATMTAQIDTVLFRAREALLHIIECDVADAPPVLGEANGPVEQLDSAVDALEQLLILVRASYKLWASIEAQDMLVRQQLMDNGPGPKPNSGPPVPTWYTRPEIPAPPVIVRSDDATLDTGERGDGQLEGLTPVQQSELFVSSLETAVREKQDPAAFAAWLVKWIGPGNLSMAIATVGVDALSELMVKAPLTLTRETKEYLAAVWNEASRQLRAQGITV